MIKHDIAQRLQEAAIKAREAGDLPAVALPDPAIERPARPEHGDYASSLPLRLGRTARAKPLDLGRTIVDRLEPSEALARIEVAPPGFINFHLSEAWLARQVDAVIDAGETFGDVPDGSGQRVQVEFVSANPTGPLHAGNGRWAAIGSALARVLAAAGYEVQTEYYFNDAGSQVDAFARTLYARYRQFFGGPVDIPEDGYAGTYMVELAEGVRAKHGDAFLRPEGEPLPPELARLGLDMVMEGIKHDLADLGVHFDVWYNEQTLYEPGGRYDAVMPLLREKGFIVEKEGAIWFASSQLGEDKDNVLVRSSSEPTYFASDIAYHYDKFLVRGFDRVINIWGADHQGHVSRMKAAVAALDVDPERLEIIIGQLVTLRRGREVVRISKRSGDIVTLREVMDEVGADACNFFFLSHSTDAPIDFDLELAKRQSVENPVYYVQYAHARIAGILALARERIPDYDDGDVSLLTHPAELTLIRKMLLLPELVESIAHNLEPHHLPHYAQELATVFHDFYEKCRVVGDDVALSKARLKLVAAARTALARTLELMGVSAPEQM
jgi:arginyl-tRNA synthetase